MLIRCILTMIIYMHVHQSVYVVGAQLSGRAFDCRSRGPRFQSRCPLEVFANLLVTSMYKLRNKYYQAECGYCLVQPLEYMHASHAPLIYQQTIPYQFQSFRVLEMPYYISTCTRHLYCIKPTRIHTQMDCKCINNYITCTYLVTPDYYQAAPFKGIYK